MSLKKKGRRETDIETQKGQRDECVCVCACFSDAPCRHTYVKLQRLIDQLSTVKLIANYFQGFC